jgi:hypothetical protein
MSHFTYDVPDASNLKQGDILNKTPEIISILKEVHPHYLKEDYKYFLVLTQTCDLVRREKGKCKSRYITLAAIRPFELLFSREALNYQDSDYEVRGNICCTDRKESLLKVIEKLFNNNDPDYLYLHEDATSGLEGSNVAFLRLSIAIKADLHYKTCLDAKFLELTSEFKAKLGWLVGNMYSRVGTKDWVPDVKEEPEFKAMLLEILNKNIIWVDRKLLKQFKTEISEDSLALMTQAQIIDALKKVRVRTRKEIFTARLKEIFKSQKVIQINDENCDTLIRTINSDPEISSVIR